MAVPVIECGVVNRGRAYFHAFKSRIVCSAAGDCFDHLFRGVWKRIRTVGGGGTRRPGACCIRVDHSRGEADGLNHLLQLVQGLDGDHAFHAAGKFRQDVLVRIVSDGDGYFAGGLEPRVFLQL